ncbi:MAG: roadblock/LC7 domain-containing protein [Gemmatimonadetes bacterium]|nr:roadblock/LC7 domain-containing protein [Gemmatimonadota bacterium]
MSARELDQLIGSLAEPIAAFFREARVRLVLVVDTSGRVLAQHGFSRAFRLGDVAALAAAAHASARRLARITGAGRWSHLHHAGRERQLFLAPLQTAAGELFLVAIFDEDSSLGLVQLFFDRLEQELTGGELAGGYGAPDARTFDDEMNAGFPGILYPDTAGES